jgi:hypothetical protein
VACKNSDTSLLATSNPSLSSDFTVPSAMASSRNSIIDCTSRWVFSVDMMRQVRVRFTSTSVTMVCGLCKRFHALLRSSIASMYKQTFYWFRGRPQTSQSVPPCVFSKVQWGQTRIFESATVSELIAPRSSGGMSSSTLLLGGLAWVLPGRKSRMRHKILSGSFLTSTLPCN